MYIPESGQQYLCCADWGIYTVRFDMCSLLARMCNSLGMNSAGIRRNAVPDTSYEDPRVLYACKSAH